jgi:hypothetical protein
MMNPSDLNEPCRGGWGESATTLDLTKPGDMALVHRAVMNGWDTPQHIRDQICDQIGAAIEAYRSNFPRDINRFLKLAKLMLAMDASTMISEGHKRSHFPYLRRRYPEKRRPRRKHRRDYSLQLQGALKKLAELKIGPRRCRRRIAAIGKRMTARDNGSLPFSPHGFRESTRKLAISCECLQRSKSVLRCTEIRAFLSFLARAAVGFGTKRSKVQILSPRFRGRNDLERIVRGPSAFLPPILPPSTTERSRAGLFTGRGRQ